MRLVLDNYCRVSRDVFVAYDCGTVVQAFVFHGVVWGRDPDSKLYVESVSKARCILHLENGTNVSFDLEGERPEEVALRIDGDASADEDD